MLVAAQSHGPRHALLFALLCEDHLGLARPHVVALRHDICHGACEGAVDDFDTGSAIGAVVGEVPKALVVVLVCQLYRSGPEAGAWRPGVSLLETPV